MEQIFTLPDLGEGLEGAEVLHWLVAEGDQVALNQPLVEVHTAKTGVEIPSPYAGVVERLHASEGQIVPVGGELVTFQIAAEAAPGPGADESGASKVLVGYGVKAESGRARRRPRLRAPDPSVERRSRRGARSFPAPDGGADQRLPLRGVRRIVAQRMTDSWRQIPHVTSFLTLDATELESFRRELAGRAGARISPLPLVVRALVEVCREYPALNASFSAGTNEIILRRSYHVGIATETDDGLLVPVIRDVDTKGIATLAREISAVVAAAREGRVTPEQLSGSTITVTNTGSFGAEFGTPIINAPEAAILSLGVIQPRALVVDGEIQVRPATILSLSFDHRVLDGAEAGRAFLALRSLLSDRERVRGLPRE